MAVFQPHRYTRTQSLMNEFFTAFNDSDKLIITDIYSAGEKPIENIDAGIIYEGIKSYGYKGVSYIKDNSKIVDALMDTIEKGDIVITLGAGNIWSVGEKLLKRIRPKKSGH